ncbi:hypothetical protein ES703_101596 [subsurface metagenome]
MDYNLEELEWKCQDCDASAPPTADDYMRLLKHQKGHRIHLVNKAGEILATSVKQARSVGIDIPKDGKPGGKPPGKPGEKPEEMELSEEGITFLITLPPVAFTLFDAAKAAKLVDEDKDLDSWLFECIQKRFELDYSLRLMLVPIEVGK